MWSDAARPASFITRAGGLTIARGRFQSQRAPKGKMLRINDMIRISPVRLVDDDDNQVGVIPLEDAKRRARETGLDLVEVSPNSTPPVCRIMDYGKWKYQQKKKEQKQKSHTKQSELKEVRLRPKIDDHDLDIKMAKARQFLGEGHKVQFTMQFRGREMAHRDIGVRILRELAATLEQISKVETHPRSQGRRMTMVLAPDRKAKEKVKVKKDAAAAAPSAPAPATPEAPAKTESAEASASA